MKKYDKKSAIKIIVHAAKEYEEKLNNKHFLIVYQKKSLTKTVEIGFRDMNFLNLTGVKTKLSAQQFYAACLESKLAERDFEIDNKGKVQQKLMVLPCLSKLIQQIKFLQFFQKAIKRNVIINVHTFQKGKRLVS